jgi:hypothetical protein
MFYGARDCEITSRVTSRKDIVTHEIKIEYEILVYAYSNLPLSYATLYSLLIKAKLIPFLYHKNILDTAFLMQCIQ